MKINYEGQGEGNKSKNDTRRNDRQEGKRKESKEENHNSDTKGMLPMGHEIRKVLHRIREKEEIVLHINKSVQEKNTNSHRKRNKVRNNCEMRGDRGNIVYTNHISTGTGYEW